MIATNDLINYSIYEEENVASTTLNVISPNYTNTTNDYLYSQFDASIFNIYFPTRIKQSNNATNSSESPTIYDGVTSAFKLVLFS